MAWAPVQPFGVQTTSRVASAAPSAVTLTTGNLVFVGVCWNAVGGTGITSLSDGTNTYTQIGTTQTVDANTRIAIFYAKNITGGTLTITFTPAANSFITICGEEYSGLDTSSPLDSSIPNTGTSTSITTTSCAVNNPNSLLVGFFGTNAGGSPSITGTSGTDRQKFTSSAGEPAALEDQTASSAAAVTWTYGASNAYAAMAASFKIVSGGPFPHYTRRRMHGGTLGMSGGARMRCDEGDWHKNREGIIVPKEARLYLPC